MAGTTFASRIAAGTVPVVLAGPIVRRVTATSASVWLATRFECEVTLHLFALGGTTPFASGTPRTTAKAGERLHIVVVTAPIPNGTVGELHYNLELNTVGGPSGDLFAPFILAQDPADARKAIAYDGDRPRIPLPPSTLAQVRILHGSCRKIAGEGEDAIGALDQVLSEALVPTSPTPPTRPTMLVLHGDNVYTDGADKTVLTVASEVGDTLLGFDEFMPGLNTTVRRIEGGRTAITLETVGMSGGRPYRVLGFGEAMALYLMMFSDVVWPPETTVDSKNFRRGLAATRKVLANIPTYMTFDDHEVGNSWNICYDWYANVLTRPLGRRVYQNCLASFALCQAWGNTPDHFEDDARPEKQFLRCLAEWVANKGIDPHRELEIRLGIPAGTPPHHLAELHTRAGVPDDPLHLDEPQIRWDFDVAHGPVHLTLLDVHTWSEYGDEKYEPARRMPVEAWLAQLAAVPAGTEIAVVAVSNVAIHSPRTAQAIRDLLAHGLRPGDMDTLLHGLFTAGYASMLGFLVLMALPHDLVIGILLVLLLVLVALLVKAVEEGYVPNFPYLLNALRSTRRIYLEEVGWGFEWGKPPFERLLARLADHYSGGTHSKIVILSGDVHNSYTMRLEYWGLAPFSLPAPPPPRQVRSQAVFAQLVSSPIKYTETKEGKTYEKGTWHLAGWSSAKPTTDPQDALTWWNKDPWVSSFVPVGAGTPRLTFDNTDPDWLYQIASVKPNGATAAALNIPVPTSVPEHVAVLKRLSDERVKEFLSSERIEASSVGDVTFVGDDVIHTAWRWWLPVGGTPRWVPTTYVVSMKLTAGQGAAPPWTVPHV